MLHRLADSVEIVDPYIAHPGPGRPDIDEDQRHLPELKVLEQHLFHAECHDSDAFHPALDHAADGAFHALWVISGRGQQDFIAVLDRNGFEDLNDLRKEGIGNFRNDETKNSAAPGNQRPRLRVRVVAEFLDYFPDTDSLYIELVERTSIESREISDIVKQ